MDSQVIRFATFSFSFINHYPNYLMRFSIMFFQMLTVNRFLPLFVSKIGVSDLMICFFTKPVASLVRNFLLSISHRFQYSYLPSARGWRLNYFLDVVECHHVIRVKLGANIIAVSCYSSCLHFLSIVKINYLQAIRCHCLIICYLRVPFLNFIFNFYLVSIIIALSYLYQPGTMTASFCFQK